MSDDATRPGNADFPPPGNPVGRPVPAPARGSMVLRHLLAAAFAMVATPIGLALLDFGVDRWRMETVTRMQDAAPAGAIAITAAGCLVLCLVAASGRVSGIGPLLAGLIWGVVPSLWMVIDYVSFFRRVTDLPEVDNHFWFGAGMYLFPIVGGLLVGAGLGGRWLASRR